MKKNIQILSTKKLTLDQKKELENANFDCTDLNFIATKNKSFEFREINEKLIFTSQNAAQSVLLHPQIEELKAKEVFCVGIKTKALLEENGFTVSVYVDYAADLAEIITLIYAKEKYTFFSGNLRKDTLPEAMKLANIDFNEIQVYETTLTPHKLSSSNPSKSGEKKFDGILFFSPSAIQSFLQENKIKNEICFCIGETTASALENITRNIIVADQPSVENVIYDVIEEYK